ncbi:hypothetical protein FZEAL_865 [Fusarium zealandicum]|uniref:Uncharacterized protein n=1 Tax=Fusarium zealandicum TaxID=1053134 RepID=A0A8H4UUQ1_9HYPO|nr:hypothetical protein FZEAL_865 [Fusarium zealandicum]
MSDGEYVDGSYWFFAPSKGAAIFFCIVFSLSGGVHVWQCSPLLELQNYHILGRILYYVPYHSPIHPGRVLTTFGFVSGIIEALNGWGASYSANQSLTDRDIETGHALIKTSLILQLVVAILFVALAVVFHRRCIDNCIKNERLYNPLVTLYVSISLILARTIYRIVECFSIAELRYGPGFDPSTISPIVRYEWFFYVFEAAVMLINAVMFNVCHPRRYLPKNNKIYLSPNGVTEVEGPGFKDPRAFLQTLVDPFDVHGLITGRGRETERFWDGEVNAPAGDIGKAAKSDVETV